MLRATTIHDPMPSTTLVVDLALLLLGLEAGGRGIIFTFLTPNHPWCIILLLLLLLKGLVVACHLSFWQLGLRTFFCHETWRLDPSLLEFRKKPLVLFYGTIEVTLKGSFIGLEHKGGI